MSADDSGLICNDGYLVSIMLFVGGLTTSLALCVTPWR